jgi:hypothetical protein
MKQTNETTKNQHKISAQLTTSILPATSRNCTNLRNDKKNITTTNPLTTSILHATPATARTYETTKNRAKSPPPPHHFNTTRNLRNRANPRSDKKFAKQFGTNFSRYVLAIFLQY